VLANPKYTKTTQRFGDKPVAIEIYTQNLPISDPIKF
jgi:hypothetical protein